MQDKHMHNDLEQLLRELDHEHQQTRTTDDISHIEANQEYDHERCMYDVEIHIYPREESEPEEPANIVESLLPIDQEPEPEEEATSVHVTLDETCTGIVYQTQALQILLTQALTVQAKQQLGTGYAPNGEVHITTTTQGTTTIQATGRSIWLYQFSQAEQERMKASIAGKSQVQTKSLLLTYTGVQSVSFSNNAPLPENAQHIRFVFITY